MLEWCSISLFFRLNLNQNQNHTVLQLTINYRCKRKIFPEWHLSPVCRSSFFFLAFSLDKVIAMSATSSTHLTYWQHTCKIPIVVKCAGMDYMQGCNQMNIKDVLVLKEWKIKMPTRVFFLDYTFSINIHAWSFLHLGSTFTIFASCGN